VNLMVWSILFANSCVINVVRDASELISSMLDTKVL
jgi:hypothetical protein